MLRVRSDRGASVHRDVARGVDQHAVARTGHVEGNWRVGAAVVGAAEVIDVERLHAAALLDGLEVQAEPIELLSRTERKAKRQLSVHHLRDDLSAIERKLRRSDTLQAIERGIGPGSAEQ